MDVQGVASFGLKNWLKEMQYPTLCSKGSVLPLADEDEAGGGLCCSANTDRTLLTISRFCWEACCDLSRFAAPIGMAVPLLLYVALWIVGATASGRLQRSRRRACCCLPVSFRSTSPVTMKRCGQLFCVYFCAARHLCGWILRTHIGCSRLFSCCFVPDVAVAPHIASRFRCRGRDCGCANIRPRCQGRQVHSSTAPSH